MNGCAQKAIGGPVLRSSTGDGGAALPPARDEPAARRADIVSTTRSSDTQSILPMGHLHPVGAHQPQELLIPIGQKILIRNRGALAFDARHGNTLHKSALGKEE